jgi:hypothetical protein
MSVHNIHTELPGYDERQILHDGCKECEWRGDDPLRALQYIDSGRFKRALARAIEWETTDRGYELAISAAEAPLLRVLWSVALHMARTGVAEFEGVNP